MLNIKRAAAFGAMMGKRAVALSPMALSSLAGAAIGGGGTAIYDWLKGTKENKLRRAMIGAGVGGLTGAGIGHLAGKLTPASKPEVQPTAPKVEKRISGIGDLKDFGEDSLAAARAKLVGSIGKRDSDKLELDAIQKRLNEDRNRMREARREHGAFNYEKSEEYDNWKKRDKEMTEAWNNIDENKDVPLLDAYSQFRSQSTSNALSNDRDRLLYDRGFMDKALASPADEPKGLFENLFYAGNKRLKSPWLLGDYPDNGPGRLYWDRYIHSLEPKTYTPALNYKMGPWQGSGDLTNRFFLPAGREGYHPSGSHEAQEIKSLTDWTKVNK